MKSALVVIDMQNGFLKPEMKSLPSRIAKNIEKSSYDFVTFTKFVNNTKTNFVQKLDWNKAFGSPETDIVPALQKYVKKNNVFEKDTYSAFKSKKFVTFLKKNKIQELYLCGVELDGCVLATAFEAFDLGYNVKVLNSLSYSSGKNLNIPSFNIVKRNIDRKVYKRKAK
jgi:nicotinamidase-related amidase